MSTIQKYLDQNNITRYRISKVTGIQASTLQAAVDSKNGINGLTGKVIIAISKALNKTPGTVLDEIIKLEEQNSKTYSN